MADDIEWTIPGDLGDKPTAGTNRGKDEVLGWFGKLTDDLDLSAFEPRDFIAQGDKVVSIVHAEATVRSTGRLVINDEAHVWAVEGGKLTRFRIYFDTTAAAAAHRLAELPGESRWAHRHVACASVRECHSSAATTGCFGYPGRALRRPQMK